MVNRKISDNTKHIGLCLLACGHDTQDKIADVEG
jgi:hypothetical protein